MKNIDYTDYNKAMDKVIKKNKDLPIEQTLIELLDEASEWQEVSKKNRLTKKRRI